MKAPCLPCKNKDLTIEAATATVERLMAENAKLKSELADLRKRFTAAADQMQAYADHPLNALRDGQKAGYASSALIARAALGEK